MQRFEGEAPVVRLALPWDVKVELSRFIALVPLAQMDFQVPVDGVVTCSDASRACSSTGLTDYGRAALNAQVRGDVPESHDLVQVLSVGLFDGIGALRVACDILGLPMAGHVSIEKDPKGHRVVESFFPEMEFFDDVVEFGEEQVAALELKYSNVGVVLVGASLLVRGSVVSRLIVRVPYGMGEVQCSCMCLEFVSFCAKVLPGPRSMNLSRTVKTVL